MSRKHKSFGGIIGAGPLVNSEPRTSGVFNLGGLSSDNGFEEPALELNFDGKLSSFTRATTSPTAAKANGDQLATGIITQNKTGSVQSKYMGPDGKLINGYVENNSPSRNPNNTYFVGAGGVTSPTKSTGFTAPDGSNTAVKFTTVQASTYYGRDTTTPVAYIQDENYTISAHFKVLSGSVSVGVLMDNDAFGGATKVYPRAQYYITAGGGAPTENTSRISGPTGFNYGIQDVGDGWYRVWVSAQADFTARLTSPTSQSSNQVFRVDETDVGDEVLIWGLQFEEGVRVPSQFIDASSDQVARVEFDASGTPLGLLVEESRTNYLWLSDIGDEFSIPSTSSTTGPDGSLGNYVPQANGLSDRFQWFFEQGHYPFIVNDKVTVSWYVKRLQGTPSSHEGELHVKSLVGFSPTTPTPYQIADLGNGWERWAVDLTVTYDNINLYLRLYIGTVQDDGAGGFNAECAYYGFQMEIGEGATSYIPNNGAAPATGASGPTTTRTADDITLSTSAFGYNTAANTVLVDFTLRESSLAYNGVYRFDDGSNNNNDIIYYDVGAAKLIRQVKDSTSTPSNTPYDMETALSPPFSRVIAARNDGTAARDAIDGTLGSLQTVVAPVTLRTTLYLGRHSTNYMTGHIRRFTYWPRAINDASLVAYTGTNRPTELEARTTRRWGGMLGRPLVSGGNVPATGVLSLAEHYQSKL